MKYKIVEKISFYVELEAENEEDARREFIKNDRGKMERWNRVITNVEKVGDFERPKCYIKIPIHPTNLDWLKIAENISMALRREGLDEQADKFLKDCTEEILYYKDTKSRYELELLEDIAKHYVKLNYHYVN